ncbi:proton extrusion protein PcxA [Planktothricoides raciborskii]|nr:proton extrusion protein PcxA [Planktothricoides raciborskii]
MSQSMSSPLQRFLTAAEHWFSQTPDRSLEIAYQAALAIQAIENQHFNGDKISLVNAAYGTSVYAHFEADLDRNLEIIKLRLTEFRNSRSFIDIYEQVFNKKKIKYFADYPNNGKSLGLRDADNLVLEKLKFIDDVIGKYQPDQVVYPLQLDFKNLNGGGQPGANSPGTLSISEKSASETGFLNQAIGTKDELSQKPGFFVGELKLDPKQPRFEKKSSKKEGNIATTTSFLPRSILRTLDRVKRDLDPDAENEVVQDFRKSQTRTVLSLKFILLIILIPLLTQQSSKIMLSPIYEKYIEPQAAIFLNVDMEEEAFRELQRFEEKLKFEKFIATEIKQFSEDNPILLNKITKLSEEEIEKQVKIKAFEIAEEYNRRSAESLKNIVADIFSAIAFCLVITNSKREIAVLKSFIDEVVYGLSDSAKAFIIILFTDVFVGFHSPHGWEVILEGICRHLGIPESREFIFLFIATFPVILDTIFKYWIFRYLNRISPSAVATYKNMNE